MRPLCRGRSWMRPLCRARPMRGRPMRRRALRPLRLRPMPMRLRDRFRGLRRLWLQLHRLLRNLLDLVCHGLGLRLLMET
jgi:hypothetical protein